MNLRGETYHPAPQSTGKIPHWLFLLQQPPYTTLQVYLFGPPQLPSGVVPVCHGNGTLVVGDGRVQFPD